MGKKIFVSYKYSDANVQSIAGIYNTTARDYVDKIDGMLEAGDYVFKGEDDDEDMSSLQDATIGFKLGDKIFDSSVTIVLISRGMKKLFTAEKDQWMPWEISYSLKEQSRDGGRSNTNAVLAVVLPDAAGNYNYFIEEDSCPYCRCRVLKTDILFQILRDNMFNIRKPVFTDCHNHLGSKPYQGYCSYIYSVKWSDFATNPNMYINIAITIRQNINDYEIIKTVK